MLPWKYLLYIFISYLLHVFTVDSAYIPGTLEREKLRVIFSKVYPLFVLQITSFTKQIELHQRTMKVYCNL
jgi:hypothetical protein